MKGPEIVDVGDAERLGGSSEGGGNPPVSRGRQRASEGAPTKIECIDCAKLPPYEDGARMGTFRPATLRKIADGCGPRSPRCVTHKRARKNAASLTSRTGAKAKTYGVPRPIQAALWEFQGRSCPCGRKRSKVIPAGVTLDHSHTAPCIVRGDHSEKTGCLECVTGFVCSHCNREVIGRLECAFRKEDDPRAGVARGLAGLHAHVTDPPLPRLLAERPDLLEQAS